MTKVVEHMYSLSYRMKIPTTIHTYILGIMHTYILTVIQDEVLRVCIKVWWYLVAQPGGSTWSPDYALGGDIYIFIHPRIKMLLNVEERKSLCSICMPLWSRPQVVMVQTLSQGREREESALDWLALWSEHLVRCECVHMFMLVCKRLQLSNRGMMCMLWSSQRTGTHSYVINIHTWIDTFTQYFEHVTEHIHTNIHVHIHTYTFTVNLGWIFSSHSSASPSCQKHVCIEPRIIHDQSLMWCGLD